MEKSQIQMETEREKDALKKLLSATDLAEKKARIYSRLLTEVSLAKATETLACRQEERKNALQRLICGKVEKKDEKKKERGKGEVNEE